MSPTYLLDTHVLLWLLAGDRRVPAWLGAAAVRAPEDFAVSDVSLWEIAIKAGLGKLRAPADLPAVVDSTGLRASAISRDAVWGTRDLPAHHRDPFDRLLISQAALTGQALITADRAMAPYDVPTVWTTPSAAS